MTDQEKQELSKLLDTIIYRSANSMVTSYDSPTKDLIDWVENKKIEWQKVDENTSDGYHTFKELYGHRINLFLSVCYLIASQNHKGQVWRSKLHSDGTMYQKFFIMGINQEAGKQITYHLPEEYWNECHWAETLDKAPEWDGHTSDDVIKRLFKIFTNYFTFSSK